MRNSDDRTQVKVAIHLFNQRSIKLFLLTLVALAVVDFALATHKLEHVCESQFPLLRRCIGIHLLEHRPGVLLPVVRQRAGGAIQHEPALLPATYIRGSPPQPFAAKVTREANTARGAHALDLIALWAWSGLAATA